MSLPTGELTETVTIKPYEGRSAYGVAYGHPVTVKGYAEPGFRRVTDMQGQDVTASLFLVLPPGTVIKALDEVEYEGRRYEVVDFQPLRQGGRIHHVEVYLKSAGVVT